MTGFPLRGAAEGMFPAARSAATIIMLTPASCRIMTCPCARRLCATLQFSRPIVSVDEHVSAIVASMAWRGQNGKPCTRTP